MMRVLAGDPVSPPPIWVMRQAGRYLPEYRETRAKAGSFLDLCYSPELAAQVTLQPIRRFGFDAAILFSDILVVPDALGQKVSFVEGQGPRLEPLPALEQLRPERVLDRLESVLETVRQVRAKLDPDKALIGFCGAPWTVATYMVAGQGTPEQLPARRLALEEPERFQRLIDILVEVSSRYLVAQLQAGADVVKIFDSWAGVLDTEGFDAWAVRPVKAIVDRVRAVGARGAHHGVSQGAGVRLGAYAEATGVDAVAVDWTDADGDGTRSGRGAGGVAGQSRSAAAGRRRQGAGRGRRCHPCRDARARAHLQSRPWHDAGHAGRTYGAAGGAGAEGGGVLMLWVKALHVISVIAWMASLLYLPRLLVYHAESAVGSEKSETFKVMEQRLLRGIAMPSMMRRLGFRDLDDVADSGVGATAGSMAKAACVVALTAYQVLTARWVRGFAEDRNLRTLEILPRGQRDSGAADGRHRDPRDREAVLSDCRLSAEGRVAI